VLGSLLVAHGSNSIQEYNSELISKLKKAEKTMALEYLGFLRTGMDVSVEYNNHDELKRLIFLSVIQLINNGIFVMTEHTNQLQRKKILEKHRMQQKIISNKGKP
jgi:hypothetical protein